MLGGVGGGLILRREILVDTCAGGEDLLEA